VGHGEAGDAEQPDRRRAVHALRTPGQQDPAAAMRPNGSAAGPGSAASVSPPNVVVTIGPQALDRGLGHL